MVAILWPQMVMNPAFYNNSQCLAPSLRRLLFRRSRHGCAGGEQGRYLALGQAGLAQDFEAMLAEPRLQALGSCRGIAEAHRQIRIEDLAFGWMSGTFEEAGRLQLRVGQDLVEARHACRGNFKAAQQRQPFGRGLAGDARPSQLVERDDVTGARCDRIEARIAMQLRLADQVPEFVPVRLRIG